MRTFFAVLKDSFREAVDGFVIYIMLALAVLTIIVVASITYRPLPAESNLDAAVQGFVIFVPDKGQAKAISAVGGMEYHAKTPRVNGTDVIFDLEVTKKLNPFDPKSDGFKDVHPIRGAVAGWLKKPYKSEKVKLPAAILNGSDSKGNGDSGFKELEAALMPDLTPEEIRAVTDDQVVEFLKNQFYIHFGLDAVTIRKKDLPDADRLTFEVEAPRMMKSRGWPHSIHAPFGAFTVVDKMPLGSAVKLVLDSLVNGIGGAVLLLISVILTSFFIPNALRKGSLDLMVSKPIGKVQYLLYKYIGGLIFIAIVASIAVGGVWLVTGLNSGIFDPRFLLVVPALVFTFALLYSFSTLIGTLTRNAIAAMLLTIFFAFVLWLIGYVKFFMEIRKAIRGETDGWYEAFDTLNNIAPRYKDLDKLTTRLIADGVMTPFMIRVEDLFFEAPSFGATIGITLLYIGIFLGLASWRHATRDG